MKSSQRDTINGMQTAAPIKRLMRPENPRAFEITERDIHILAFVARLRFATADQIVRFTAGSEKNVGTRIRHLFWNSFLNRTDDQRALIVLFNLLGNTSAAYTLGPAGKQLLAQRGIFPMRSRAKAPLIPHTIATTEFVLSCALASRADGAPRFIDHGDLLPAMPQATRALEHPFRFRVPFQEDFKTINLNVDPDRLASFFYADNHRHNFCVEIDLGNETIAKRRNHKIVLAKSTFARKQAGYYFGWKDGRHRTQWDWQGFRVLTITTSEQRIETMLTSQREITNDRATSLFLYTTFNRLADQGPFAPIWISSEGDNISIIDRR